MKSGANVTAEGNGNKTFDGTLHWFEVNIDDLGEPGGHNQPEGCDPLGFGRTGWSDCDHDDRERPGARR